MIPYLSQSKVKIGEPEPRLQELAEGLRKDVTILASDIGPRGTFAPDRYKLAEDFLINALTKTGYSVNRLAYMEEDIECANLEVTVRGRNEQEEIIVVGAHYDSVMGCPAANDNGSGVAGVLALARLFSCSLPKKTIRFVLFANEEPPYFNFNSMGSQIYARACRKAGDNIRGMVCLETIGCFSDAPNSQVWPHPALDLLLSSTGDFITLVGPSSAQDFIKVCAEAFEKQNAISSVSAAAPDSIDQVLWSDHRGFNEVGYPAFMVTDTAPFRYLHYHKSTDTPDKLDYVSMARVINGVKGMLREITS